jgi:hypothetical protein
MTAQLADKEQAIQELATQSAQKARLLEDTLNSRAWKFAVAGRKLRSFLLPPGSLRERFVRFLAHRSQ